MFISKFAAPVALVAALGAAGLAEAESITLSVGSSHPEAATANKLFKEYFIPEVQKRAQEAGIELSFTEAWSGALCKPGECLNFVKDGLLDIGDIQVAYETGKVPFAAFSFYAPFSSPDPRVTQQAGDRISSSPEFQAYLEKHFNQVYLTNVVLGDYMLVTNFTWDDLSELQGHKIAAAPTLLPIMKGTGIVPVQGNYNEAYVALQTGVYDGWFLPADSIVAVKLEEVTKQAVGVGLGAVQNAIFTVNKDRWDSLPEELRVILKEVGADYAVKQAALAYERHNAALEKMKAAGLVVRDLDDEKRRAWAAGLDNLPKENSAALAADMPQTIYEFVEIEKSLGYTFPRDWSAEK